MTAPDGEHGEVAVQRPRGQSTAPPSDTVDRTLAREQREPAVVLLPAEIDVCNREQVNASLTLALADGISVLIADGRLTGFCDCSGVHALIRASHEAAAAGVQLRVVASPAIRRILALTGADDLLDTCISLSDAMS